MPTRSESRTKSWLIALLREIQAILRSRAETRGDRIGLNCILRYGGVLRHPVTDEDLGFGHLAAQLAHDMARIGRTSIIQRRDTDMRDAFAIEAENAAA